MDMGTGKTKTTIELLDINKEKYDQILIICPISVRGAWVEQVKKYSINDSDVRILGVSTKKEQDDYKNWNDESTKATKWLIIGTESIGASLKTQKILTEYVKKRRTALVVDESHYFSNHTAFRTKYMMETAPKCVLRYFLTGTKIVKHLGDLFPTLTMMSPDILGTSNFYTFRAKYLITNEVPIGSNRSIKAIIGVKNEEEFLKKINRFVFICKKDDVLDLPKKRYKTLTLPVEKEHVKYLRNVKKMILEESNSTVLHKIQMIKAAQRIFAGYYNTQTETGMVKTPIFSPKKDPKLRTALQIVRDHDGQIIIWAASRYQIESMTKLMQEEKISCASFYGATPKEDRQDIIKGFQAGRYKVIVANPSVGGSGIELTNADLVIYLSNTHNYGDRAQSEDRCHRIGQTKSVLYIDIVYQNTYDVVILQALQEKKDLSRVLDALQLENHIGC
jgi:SNF2 family DNA or RNA helicase